MFRVSSKRRNPGSGRAFAIANFGSIRGFTELSGGAAEKCARRRVRSPDQLAATAVACHDALNWGWASLLHNIYLPVAVFPPLIAFPENCKHKY